MSEPTVGTVGTGDWVAFLQNGRVVVGIVLYVQLDSRVGYKLRVFTDQGAIGDADLLEVRQRNREGR